MSLQDEVHHEAEDRANRKLAIAEAIENDADTVRNLVLSFLDDDESPVMSSAWTADLLIALRESKLLLKSLCEGDTLEQAMAKHPGGIDHFRTLLRCADDADTWIAKLISEEAEERL